VKYTDRKTCYGILKRKKLGQAAVKQPESFLSGLGRLQLFHCPITRVLAFLSFLFVYFGISNIR
jgi:hypothetical protein